MVCDDTSFIMGYVMNRSGFVYPCTVHSDLLLNFLLFSRRRNNMSSSIGSSNTVIQWPVWSTLCEV